MLPWNGLLGGLDIDPEGLLAASSRNVIADTYMLKPRLRCKDLENAASIFSYAAI